MGKIEPIYLRGMRNGVHYQFMEDILKLAQEDAKVKQKCGTQIDELEKALEEEDKCLKVTTKNLKTDLIRKADEKRGKMYAKYKTVIRAFIDYPDEEMAEAAKHLMQSVKDYNINTKTSLQQESGLIGNLIKDIEGPLAKYISALNIGTVVQELKSANEEVKRLMRERSDETARHKAGSLNEARAECDKVYLAIVEMVNALTITEGAADYASFINHVNVTATEYKRNAMKQKTDTPKNIPDDGEEGSGTPGTGGDGGGSGSDTPGTGGSTGGSGDEGGNEGGGSGGSGSDFD